MPSYGGIPTVAGAYNDAIIQQQQIAENNNQLQIQKLALQADATALQNQQQYQQQVGQIWNNPNLDPQSKMLQMAIAGVRYGKPADSEKALSAYGMYQYRQTEMVKQDQVIASKRAQQAAQYFSGITDQASEDSAFAQARAEGIDLTLFGASGQYVNDAPNLPQMSARAMTAYQKAQADYRAGELQQTQTRDTNNFMLGQARLGVAQGQLGLAQKRLDLQMENANHNWQIQDNKDARAQAAADRTTDRSYMGAMKVQPEETKTALSIFAADDRTSGLPQSVQQAYARAASAIAKRQIADEMRKEGTTDYLPEDFESALSHVMDQMAGEGLFKQEQGGFFGGGQPGTYKTTPRGQTKVGAPAPAPGSPAAKARAQEIATEYKNGKPNPATGKPWTRAEALEALNALGIK